MLRKLVLVLFVSLFFTAPKSIAKDALFKSLFNEESLKNKVKIAQELLDSYEMSLILTAYKEGDLRVRCSILLAADQYSGKRSMNDFFDSLKKIKIINLKNLTETQLAELREIDLSNKAFEILKHEFAAVEHEQAQIGTILYWQGFAKADEMFRKKRYMEALIELDTAVRKPNLISDVGGISLFIMEFANKVEKEIGLSKLTEMMRALPDGFCKENLHLTIEEIKERKY